MYCRGNISSRCSSNSGADASELLENREETVSASHEQINVCTFSKNKYQSNMG